MKTYDCRVIQGQDSFCRIQPQSYSIAMVLKRNIPLENSPDALFPPAKPLPDFTGKPQQTN